MDRQELIQKLKEILKEVDADRTRNLQITDQTSIREGLGLDSLQLAEMLFEIEERLGAKVTDEEAQKLRNVGELLNIIESRLAAK